WRIYYDPLISRVSNQYRGYSLNSSYITQQKAEKINSSFSVLAFMDDTMWIANSKQEMSNILLIASSFFTLTNIKVNPTKSVLATINSEQYSEIVFDNTILHSINKPEAFRFLSYWYSTTKQH